MIAYFTGTGNSRYIAEQLTGKIDGETICLNDIIRRKETLKIPVADKMILVTPTYAWRIPKLVEGLLLNADSEKQTKVWFVMNCGSEIGNAAKYNQEICSKKGWTYKGTAQVKMPENYLAMFKVPGIEEAKRTVNYSKTVIDELVVRIVEDRNFDAPRNNLYDKFMSRFVNPLFYKNCIKTDKFRVSECCVGCGKCRDICPIQNIAINEGRPEWGSNCTHCMACIAYCPKEAIEYGKKSVGQLRYTVEKAESIER